WSTSRARSRDRWSPPSRYSHRPARRDHQCAAHAACPAHVLHKEVLAKRFREHLGSQAGDEIGRPTGWIGHDDAYGPVRVVGVMRGVRAGKQRDTYEQGNKISTSHCSIGHSITSSARASSIGGLAVNLRVRCWSATYVAETSPGHEG